VRIGIDLTSIWRPATGNERVAIEMVRSLLQNDSPHEYVLFFAKRVHSELEEFAGRFEPILSPWSNELPVKHLWFPRAIATAHLDYLHFPTFPPPWFNSCEFGWTLPDATPWLFPDTMKISSRYYYTILGRRAFNSARLLITDTEASRRDLIRVGAIPSEVHVLYPAPKPVFQQCEDETLLSRVRFRYSLPEEFILFVGTLEPRKNLKRILRALSRARMRDGFEPELVIVGRTGWCYDPILSEIDSQGLREHVYLTGHVPDEDLLAIYNMARLLVFPSIYEGFGLPAIEAMACGCPVVTSNRGAQLEITRESAVHCDPEDVESIATAIQTAYCEEELRAQLVSSGLRRAASFSWDRYAREFLDIISGSCGKETVEESSEQQTAMCTGS
jgi:glycosyltransferase involved in cell wall biosynthesis